MCGPGAPAPGALTVPVQTPCSGPGDPEHAHPPPALAHAATYGGCQNTEHASPSHPQRAKQPPSTPHGGPYADPRPLRPGTYPRGPRVARRHATRPMCPLPALALPPPRTHAVGATGTLFRPAAALFRVGAHSCHTRNTACKPGARGTRAPPMCSGIVLRPGTPGRSPPRPAYPVRTTPHGATRADAGGRRWDQGPRGHCSALPPHCSGPGHTAATPGTVRASLVQASHGRRRCVPALYCARVHLSALRPGLLSQCALRPTAPHVPTLACVSGTRGHGDTVPPRRHTVPGRGTQLPHPEHVVQAWCRRHTGAADVSRRCTAPGYTWALPAPDRYPSAQYAPPATPTVAPAPTRVLA